MKLYVLETVMAATPAAGEKWHDVRERPHGDLARLLHARRQEAARSRVSPAFPN